MPGSLLVVGGGYIGLEMAENLRHRGLEVTLVELADQVMGPVDPEMATPLHRELRRGRRRRDAHRRPAASGLYAVHPGLEVARRRATRQRDGVHEGVILRGTLALVLGRLDRRAAERLVSLMEQTADLDVECGGLYHAAHGLALYRSRTCPP